MAIVNAFGILASEVDESFVNTEATVRIIKHMRDTREVRHHDRDVEKLFATVRKVVIDGPAALGETVFYFTFSEASFSSSTLLWSTEHVHRHNPAAITPPYRESGKVWTPGRTRFKVHRQAFGNFLTRGAKSYILSLHFRTAPIGQKDHGQRKAPIGQSSTLKVVLGQILGHVLPNGAMRRHVMSSYGALNMEDLIRPRKFSALLFEQVIAHPLPASPQRRRPYVLVRSTHLQHVWLTPAPPSRGPSQGLIHELPAYNDLSAVLFTPRPHHHALRIPPSHHPHPPCNCPTPNPESRLRPNTALPPPHTRRRPPSRQHLPHHLAREPRLLHHHPPALGQDTLGLLPRPALPMPPLGPQQSLLRHHRCVGTEHGLLRVAGAESSEWDAGRGVSA